VRGIEGNTYQNSKFADLVNEAISFFISLPSFKLTELTKFTGVGVYALYCNSKFEPYSDLKSIINGEAIQPIYVGKAVPTGWRQAKSNVLVKTQGTELFRRINEHKKSIESVNNLDHSDFFVRFMMFSDELSDMVSTIESRLISRYKPLWNTAIDGFGNHDPGKGRYQQAKSDWDVIHPGRAFADKCLGDHNSLETVLSKIATTLK
jgi:hypothetical protein